MTRREAGKEVLVFLLVWCCIGGMGMGGMVTHRTAKVYLFRREDIVGAKLDGLGVDGGEEGFCKGEFGHGEC